MRRKWKFAVIALALVSALGLVAVTFAWFVDLSVTPLESIASAVVRYLPEGDATPEALLDYGSLISGKSISPVGVPHILPGDGMLGEHSVSIADGITTHIVHTSRARPLQEGETAGTVRYSEIRTFSGADGDYTVTRTQRDLMDTETLPEYWTDQNGTMVADPGIQISEFDAVTTTEVRESSPPGQDVKETIITTTYIKRAGETETVYRRVRISRVTVTHEPETFSPPLGAGASWDSALQLPRTEIEETVLNVRGDVSRTRTRITERRSQRAGDTATDGLQVQPMSIGNCSTVETNVRIGVSAKLIKNTAVTPLILRYQGGVWYLGLTDESGSFVELFLLRLAAREGYQWTQVGSKALWDLDLPDGSTVPAAGLPQDGEPEPVVYAAVDSLTLAARSDFGLSQTTFEDKFNDLYCTNSPMIYLEITYYAKQADYMDWTEFHTSSMTMQL